MPRDESKTLTLIVPRGSNLDLILRGFNGATNKLADAIGGGLHAVALALATPHDNSKEVQEQIDKYTQQVRSLRTSLETATHNETKETE